MTIKEYKILVKTFQDSNLTNDEARVLSGMIMDEHPEVVDYLSLDGVKNVRRKIQMDIN